MKAVAALLTLAVLVVTSACSNPKNLRITDQNKETFMEEIKNSKKLTVEEVGLLQGYLMRYGVIEGLKGLTGGENELPLEGKTVGELIELQRKWAEETKAEEARQKKLAEEAKAREEALAAELRKCITLAVWDKGFVDSDYRRGLYQDLLTYSITYENNSPKDIRAFQGTVVFQDLFGDRVNSFGLKITDPIKSGEKAQWKGTTAFNQFDKEDTRLRDAELKDLKVVWMPERIIFADGTSIPEGSTPNED